MRTLELRRLVDLLEELKSHNEGRGLEQEIDAILKHITGEVISRPGSKWGAD